MYRFLSRKINAINISFECNSVLDVFQTSTLKFIIISSFFLLLVCIADTNTDRNISEMNVKPSGVMWWQVENSNKTQSGIVDCDEGSAESNTTTILNTAEPPGWNITQGDWGCESVCVCVCVCPDVLTKLYSSAAQGATEEFASTGKQDN